ncbi:MULTISPECIES: hypothetical protein [Microbacterium]|uniref:hypothetical protein n=1 Tax=Microbacterium TaxID=33882 RepID=UPI0027D77D67|nr:MULTISPECIES: hypothetical protein [Microbacterium]
MRRHGRGSRVARGAVASSVATFVALLSHVSAGGAMPGIVGVAVPLALSFVVCAALAGRRSSVWRSSLAVVVSQALFHALFVLGSYDLGAAGHVHGAVAIVTAGEASAQTVSMDAAMTAGHLVAAALTTLALHRGERALVALGVLGRRCIAWVRSRVRVVVPRTGPAPARRLCAAIVAEVSPVSVVVVGARARRGPPLPAS